jgi:phage-related protein
MLGLDVDHVDEAFECFEVAAVSRVERESRSGRPSRPRWMGGVQGGFAFAVSAPSYDLAVAKRRWRDYRTSTGRRPVKDFIDGLSDGDAAAVVAAMKEVQVDGLVAARHLRGEIFEVRADGDHQAFRVLFAMEGRSQHVLLALDAISKKTQKTPPEVIRLAERRLVDWRRRARS